MKSLYTWMSALMLACTITFIPSSCTLPWANEDKDEFDITSKFIAAWNIHESVEENSDGSITYNAVKYGGLVGLVKERNLPVDWTNYGSLVFEFEKPTEVETQVLIGKIMRAWGRKGITRLVCYFDVMDLKQVDEVVLQTSDPTVLKIKSVRLTPATTSWDSTPIWKGECKFDNWVNGFTIDPEVFATAVEGDKLEFIFTTDDSDPKRTYWQFKTIYSSTDQTLEGNYSEQNEWGATMVGHNATKYRVSLTANDVKMLKEKGLFTNGFYVDVTQVNLLHKGSETATASVPGEPT